MSILSVNGQPVANIDDRTAERLLELSRFGVAEQYGDCTEVGGGGFPTFVRTELPKPSDPRPVIVGLHLRFENRR
jgi:hypothetical protein